MSGRDLNTTIVVGKSSGSTARNDSGTSKTWSLSVVFSTTTTRPSKRKMSSGSTFSASPRSSPGARGVRGRALPPLEGVGDVPGRRHEQREALRVEAQREAAADLREDRGRVARGG